MPELTAKRIKFVEGILSGMTKADAYRNAYSTKNMGDEAIRVEACRLAANPNVSLVLEQKQKEMENEQLWTRKDALTELASVGKANIKQYLSYKTAKVPVGVDKETGEPLFGYKQIVDLIDSQDVDGRVVQEVSLSKDGTLKIKLHDKLKAIELANKMCGYNEPDKVHVTGINPFDGLSEEELRKLLDK